MALAGIALILALIAAQSWMLLHLARQQGRRLLDAMEARAQGGMAPAIQPSSQPLGLLNPCVRSDVGSLHSRAFQPRAD